MKSTDKFVDSNTIIYAFSHHKYQEKCFNFLKKNQVITNTLILVEAYSKIKTIVDEEQANKAIKMLYRLNNIKIVDLDKNMFFETLKRTKNYDLKISDLIHYTTALLSNCSEIISYDDHFDKLEIKRIIP